VGEHVLVALVFERGVVILAIVLLPLMQVAGMLEIALCLQLLRLRPVHRVVVPGAQVGVAGQSLEGVIVFLPKRRNIIPAPAVPATQDT